MGNYLGHPNADADIQNLIYPALVPTNQPVTAEELDAIQSYYEQHAPATVAPAFARAGTLPTTSLFIPEHWPGYRRAVTVSLVKIDPEHRRLYLGAADPALIHIFGADKRLLNRVNCDQNPAVDLELTTDGFNVVLMGVLERDLRQASAHQVRVGRSITEPLGVSRVVTGFHRTSGADWGDLDGDGDNDVVMAGFGDYSEGSLAWFELEAGEGAIRHELRPGSGPLDAEIDDVDGDGDLDILSIIAQGHQEMVWFENDGKGRFRQRLLWKERPGLGYNTFQWIDFDGDGRKDILAVSGNNMELADPPLKSMHGIYVYRQEAPMEFRRSLFLRMDGATKAIAADFDKDGDCDIAAISAYPDWHADHPATFVLFTNDGDGKFSTSTVPDGYIGQPITMDSGDLDGDGDLDLVIGGASWAPNLTGPLLDAAKRYVRDSSAVVVLWNQTSSPVPQGDSGGS